MFKKLLTTFAMFAAGVAGGGMITYHQSAEAKERRAIAALCNEGGAVYLRCEGAECKAGAPGDGVMQVKPGQVYRYPLEGGTFAWQLTRTSTKAVAR